MGVLAEYGSDIEPPRTDAEDELVLFRFRGPLHILMPDSPLIEEVRDIWYSFEE